MVWSQGGAMDDIFSHLGVAKKPLVLPQMKPVAQRLHAPMSLEEKTAQAFDNSNSLHNVVHDMGNYDVAPDPQYDWAAKAENAQSQLNNFVNQAAAQRMHNSQIALSNSNVNLGLGGIHGGGGGGGMPTGNRLQAFIKAISGQESGGNYGAVNNSSGAMGKYQIMPSNIAGSGGWDREALGHDITTQRFLHSAALQERIAQYKLQQYFSKYGARGAASAWYSGDPNKWRNGSPQGGYPSIAAYVQSIIRRMRGYM